MASAPWSPQELALLEQHAGSCDWRTVAAELTDRTAKSIKVRMAKLRGELGLGDGRRADDDDAEQFHTKAAIASASRQLRDATLRVGVWQ